MILAVGLAPPLMAIDGDLGMPYAPGQGSTPPAQRAPGAEKTYGGLDADVPPMTLFGGVLVILGAGASGIGWRRSRLSAP